jgi:hypothetical protein
MEQKSEREWRWIACPAGKTRTLVMCEWDIVSGEGRIFKRTLRQVDCHHPGLTEFGGRDCNWDCERIISKRDKRDL